MSTGAKREIGWGITGGSPRPAVTPTVRHVAFDTNYWKSFTQARLAVAHGDRGCLSLFAGKDHRMLADHLTSELRCDT
jgi:hypothetical protein